MREYNRFACSARACIAAGRLSNPYKYRARSATSLAYSLDFSYKRPLQPPTYPTILARLMQPLSDLSSPPRKQTLEMASSMMAASQVAFEPRDFMHAENYPSMDDHHVPGGDADTFADPHEAVANDLTDGVSYNGGGVPNFDGTDNDLDLDTPPPQHDARTTPHPPPGQHLQQVMKAKVPPKPSRAVVQNAEGKFVCTADGCEEPVREFARKCEWKLVFQTPDRVVPRTNPCSFLLANTWTSMSDRIRASRAVAKSFPVSPTPAACCATSAKYTANTAVQRSP